MKSALISRYLETSLIFQGSNIPVAVNCMRCFAPIWYHLCNLKNVKSTHGEVLLLVLKVAFHRGPAGMYLFEVNNKNSRTIYKIGSNLIRKTSERRHWLRSRIFIVNFEQILHIVLLIFYCCLWTSKCQLAVFFMFFKLHKLYQITQRITYLLKNISIWYQTSQFLPQIKKTM